MKKLWISLALLLAASAIPSAAGEHLTHAEILDLLTGATVEGSNWTQSFEKGGATEYLADGKKSEGRWDVQGDQYCSMWPPSDQWTCYAVATAIDAAGAVTITWIAADGSQDSAHFRTKGQ